MAIESAVMFRRVARIARVVPLIGVLLGGAAMAQLPITFTPGNPPPVTVGSIIPFSHGATGEWSQIYSMKIDHYGNILFLDSALSEIYELAAGATVPTVIAKPAANGSASDCSNLEAVSPGYWNAGIAFDAWNNLYITDRYGSVQFCRVPYNASTGSWTFSNQDIWAGAPTYTNPTSGAASPIYPQDIQTGDDGTFYVSSSGNMTSSIFKFTVNQSGAVTAISTLAFGLEDTVTNIAVDHAGNLFFIEGAYDTPSKRVTGIREIAAGSTVTGCAGDGKCESALPRIDPAAEGFNGIKGLTFDAAGNLYFTSQNNASYGGAVDGVFMIPNEGTPKNPNLVWADTVRIAPVSSGFPVMIDPRGLLWIPTGGGGNWQPAGSDAAPCSNTNVSECIASSVIIWKPGAAKVGASPVSITAYSANTTSGVLTLTANNALTPGQLVTISASSGDGLYPLNGLSFYVSGIGLLNTQFEISTPLVAGAGSSAAIARATQTFYYSFSKQTTPKSFALAQPGGNNFKVLATNPIIDTTVVPPVPPCTAGTTYPAFSGTETAVAFYSWCVVNVELNTQTTGSVESELQMLDSNNDVIEGSNVYLNGVGIGSAISMVSSAATQPIASGLNEPMQVAADAWGNSYVADSALKAIEFYPAGTISPVVGTTIGTGLKQPTGVAVDGAGNVFIGDTGSIIEVPYINGKLAASQQTTLLTGLGDHLNLAADASGDVFVADKDNKQVVEVPNPQTSLLLVDQPLLTLGAGAGFKGPSAIATDNSGNVWVADASNLWEITMPLGVASEVISGGLQAPVTGLAVDPSGSVFVAGANGVTWIPFSTTTGGLNTSSTVKVVTGLGAGSAQTPFSIALDGFENAYVTYGSGSTAAGMAQVGIGGTLDFDNFGEVNPNVPFEADAQIFNLGNSSLTLAAFSNDSFSGANASDFAAGAATENSPACGPSTSTAQGSFCYLGLVVTAPSAGPTSASVTAMSNALNAPAGINIALSATVVQDYRWASQTSVAIAPASGKACGSSTGSIYPGCQTVTVTVKPAAGEPPTVGTPQGSVILSVGSASGNLPRQTLTLSSSGVASYTYPNLGGGTYTVNALFSGEGVEGSAQNTCSPAGSSCFAGSPGQGSFTITPATPAFVVGPPVTNSNCLNWTTLSNGSASSNCSPNPSDVTPWAGNIYVNWQQPVWVLASVTSTVGTPTGTVSFLLPSGKPADSTQGINGAIPLNGNGIAVFSLANLPQGVESLTVKYNGDPNFATVATSGSSNASFQVVVPSIQVCVGCTASTAPAATTSITPGTADPVTLTLMPLVGFSSNVSVECVTATLPPDSECTFAYPNAGQGVVGVGQSGPTASTLVVTLSTNVPVNGGASASLARRTPWPLSLAGLFGLGLLGLIAGRKRCSRYLTMLCLAAMLAGAFIGITACTNAGYSTPLQKPPAITPAGTYNVQIITYNPSTSQQNSLTTPVFVLTATVQ